MEGDCLEMNVKRLLVLLLIVAAVFTAVIWTSPNLLGKLRLGLDLKGGFEILYQAETIEPGKEVTQDALRETSRSLTRRAQGPGGVGEPEISPEGSDRIRARIAGVSDQEAVREILKKPANLTFRAFDGTVEMTGLDFVENGASVGYDDANQPLVVIELKSAEKFREITDRLSKLQPPTNRLGIYLDEEEISNPSVNFPISGGSAQITGQFTFLEAKALADIINLGALPLRLTEIYTQTVGATLGQASLDQTVRAGIIGYIIVLIFMIVY